MLSLNLSIKSTNLVRKGFPWIYNSELGNLTSALELAGAGELIRITDNKGKFLATGFFNPYTNIACRIISYDKNETIDGKFFKNRFRKALDRRLRIFAEGYFRLVFGESDNLPGLVADLYGEYAVVQVNSAGMERLMEFWLPELVGLLGLKGIFLDAGSKHRSREGLDDVSRIIHGIVPEILAVRENGLVYFADLLEGQKTGWFYDQRDNRKFLAGLAKGKSFLDLYTHSGGFGLAAAANNAEYTELVDRSALALDLAKKAVAENGLKNCKMIKAEVFDYLESATKKFDVVNADPPAFIKSKNNIEVGLKGYEKLVKKCLKLTNEGGIFAISSCSYFVRPEQFRNCIEKAMRASGRDFKLIRKASADKDHPIHPMLGETNYLKFFVYRLD